MRVMTMASAVLGVFGVPKPVDVCGSVLLGRQWHAGPGHRGQEMVRREGMQAGAGEPAIGIA